MSAFNKMTWTAVSYNLIVDFSHFIVTCWRNAMHAWTKKDFMMLFSATEVDTFMISCRTTETMWKDSVVDPTVTREQKLQAIEDCKELLKNIPMMRWKVSTLNNVSLARMIEHYDKFLTKLKQDLLAFINTTKRAREPCFYGIRGPSGLGKSSIVKAIIDITREIDRKWFNEQSPCAPDFAPDIS